MDPMGGIVMTNDGNAILREIQVQHPAAKSMIEISRTQDEEVGDGTTSVVVLAGEVLQMASQYIEEKIHPTTIIAGYRQALDDMLDILKNCLGTKFLSAWSEMSCKIALTAVRTCSTEQYGRREIDINDMPRLKKSPVEIWPTHRS